MPSRRRKRNKSSPGQKPYTKKYRFAQVAQTESHSDSEDSVYFESLDLSDSKTSDSVEDTTPITPPTLEQFAMNRFSDEELKQLGAVLGPIVAQSIKNELINELKQEFKAVVDAETSTLKVEISTLKSANHCLKTELDKTKLELDELEQYGRRMCLDISGIPGDTADPREDVEAKILEYTRKHNIPLTSSDIDKCHRKGRPKVNINRKVIIKFTNSKARQCVYEARKRMGDGIFVQENLTRLREHIGFEARQLVRAKLVTRTWVAGCKIYALFPGDSKSRVIDSMDVIDRIREGRSTSQEE